jgi:DHA1 family bicyclomycin/chloramphenicol resistance-like MFS transporter
MAQVMSTAMIVFMLAPVLAPSLGQAVLAVGSWRLIFIALGLYALALAVWGGLRLPETLAQGARRPLSAGHIGSAALETLSNRVSIGNTAAVTVTFGGLLAYVGSVQQIVFDVFHRPSLIGLVFACVALPMSLSAWLNSRLVMRFGSRRLLLAALATFTGFAALHLAVILTFGETIWSFVALQALTMGCFGLIGSNSGALAMEPMGHIAGTASALQGLISTIGGALIGLAIGQMFDGTTLPLIAGFVVCGALGLAIAWAANAGLPAHSRNELSEPIEPPLA